MAQTLPEGPRPSQGWLGRRPARPGDVGVETGRSWDAPCPRARGVWHKTVFGSAPCDNTASLPKAVFARSEWGPEAAPREGARAAEIRGGPEKSHEKAASTAKRATRSFS